MGNKLTGRSKSGGRLPGIPAKEPPRDMSVKERREREEKARLEAILASAETVFARSGYYEARMEDIAREAELAKGTLYYYFKSKDEIYLHLLEREARAVHEEISRRITEDASLLEALREAFDLYLEYFEAHPAYLKLFVPCLCGTIRFEGSAMRAGRPSTRKRRARSSQTPSRRSSAGKSCPSTRTT
jgi:AcrR family transcriptional regulator